MRWGRWRFFTFFDLFCLFSRSNLGGWQASSYRDELVSGEDELVLGDESVGPVGVKQQHLTYPLRKVNGNGNRQDILFFFVLVQVLTSLSPSLQRRQGFSKFHGQAREMGDQYQWHTGGRVSLSTKERANVTPLSNTRVEGPVHGRRQGTVQRVGWIRPLRDFKERKWLKRREIQDLTNKRC